MKTPKMILSLALPLLLFGCASIVPTPPSGLEQVFFTVVTNYVPIVTSTTQILVATNDAGVTWVTNTTFETNWAEGYDFAPSSNAVALIETGTVVGNFFGIGGIVGTLLATVFGVWAKLRSNTAFKMAAVLTQIIETGRKVLGSLPHGHKLEDEWVAWMTQHQTDEGVVLEVAKLLKQAIDAQSAQTVAKDLIEMSRTKPSI